MQKHEVVEPALSRGWTKVNVIVSNLSRDNILFSTFYIGLFLLFRKKTGGDTGPPGPSPCYGTGQALERKGKGDFGRTRRSPPPFSLARNLARNLAPNFPSPSLSNACHPGYLPRTQTSLSQWKCAVCTLPTVPCGSSPVARLYLAKNEAPEEEAGMLPYRIKTFTSILAIKFWNV